MAALARAAFFVTLHQRGQHAGVGVHAGGDVGYRIAGFRRFVGRAGDRQQTGFALNQQVVRFFVAVGAVFAVARDVADDECRVQLVKHVEREPHARGGSWCQVLHQHVSFGQQGLQHVERSGLLQVKRQAFLGAIGPDKVRCLTVHAGVVGTSEVARAGPLDLDDAGAQVSELTRAERRGDGMFERNDGDAVKRSGHGD